MQINHCYIHSSYLMYVGTYVVGITNKKLCSFKLLKMFTLLNHLPLTAEPT